jgi:hypothetical protein
MDKNMQTRFSIRASAAIFDRNGTKTIKKRRRIQKNSWII